MGGNKKKKSKIASTPSKEKNSHHDTSNDDANRTIDDERFAAANTRPQFQKSFRHDSNNNDNNTKNSSLLLSSLSSSAISTAIANDDRFAKALTDDRFGFLPERDKYGREQKKKKKKKKERGNLEAHEEGDNAKDDAKDDDKDDDKDDGNEEMDNASEEYKNGDDIGGQDMESRIAYLNALSRGDISLDSSSGDDSSEESDGSDGEDSEDGDESSSDSIDVVRGKAGVLDPSYRPRLVANHANHANHADHDDHSDHAGGMEIELDSTPSPYLAILNLDWYNIRAKDIYCMLHSFCPPGGLDCVRVYPSDFGLKMMERERALGPVGLWKEDDPGDSAQLDIHDSDHAKPKVPKEFNQDQLNQDQSSEDQSSEDQSSEDQSSEDQSNEDEDMEEDILNIQEATAKLYSHFPPQSHLNKSSTRKNSSRNNNNNDDDDDDIDQEKLRAYEASKLKYYFAIATFHSLSAADQVYHQIDGIEMEHSAAEIDVRTIPPDQYSETIHNRTCRDECHELPSKYDPPDAMKVVTALRQSKISCTWESGDVDREKKLTRYYGMGKDAWDALAEGDDIKLYLASDVSSQEEDDDDQEDDASVNENQSDNKDINKDEKKKPNETNQDKNEKKQNKSKKKGAGMRALLGLDDENEDETDPNNDQPDNSESDEAISDDSEEEEDSESDDEDSDNQSKDNNKTDKTNHQETIENNIPPTNETNETNDDNETTDDDDNNVRQIVYTPRKSLEQKIRSKLNTGSTDNNDGEQNELTPFEKYLQKRKEKRKERRRKKNQQGGTSDDNSDDGDDMYRPDPEMGMAQFSDEDGDSDGNFNNGNNNDDNNNNGGDDDGFFIGQKETKSNKQRDMTRNTSGGKVPSTKEELELLIAGDDDEEHQKDYDMRGILKLEKYSHKKLKNKKRRRQLEQLAARVSGQEFVIDTKDDRFAPLLDGTDDRFGIDRTHPNYKETGAMKMLLEEQRQRRKQRNGKRARNDNQDDANDNNADDDGDNDGSNKKNNGNSNKKLKEGQSNGIGDDGRGGGTDPGNKNDLSFLVKRLQHKVGNADVLHSTKTKKKRKKSTQ